MKYAGMFERLLANSREADDDDLCRGCFCWLWTGKRDARGDYGHVTRRVPVPPIRGILPNGKLGEIAMPSRVVPQKAHRVMAETVLDRKLDPETETIQHACDQGLCINPWHFDLATRVENSRDRQMKGLGRERQVFVPMLDPLLWGGRDALVRVKPYLRSTIVEEACPF